MHFRQILSCTIVSGIFLVSAALSYPEKSHDGKVVSVTAGTGTADGKLVMTDKDGKNEHSHAIAASAKITRNDKTVKLGDLKKGDFVTVTTSDDGKVAALSAKDSNSAGSSDSDAKSETPDILKDLKLSSDQQAKINDIVKKYDDECDSTWKEFSDRYQRAVRTEASMLAAIEEHFTDGQRKHLQQQRRRAAHRKHHDGKSDAKVTRDTNANTVDEEIVIVGVTLTPEQETKAQRVRRHFDDRLGSLNDDIDRLHAKMIALETEKLLDIEDVLTKDQRDQLRKDHEKLTRSVDSSDKTSTK